MRALAVAAVAVVCASAGAASAGPARDAVVRPGVGIGTLRLGMSLPEARRASAAPLRLARSSARPVRVDFRVYATRDGLLQVAMLGPRENARVARIVATGRAKTRGGVGVGSDIAAVKRKLLPIESTCRANAVFLNYKLHGRRTTECAIVADEVVTVFHGRSACAVVPARYQGCPQIRVQVAAVAVESLALRRYGLSGWPTVPRRVGLFAREAGEGGRVAVPAGGGAKFRPRE